MFLVRVEVGELEGLEMFGSFKNKKVLGKLWRFSPLPFVGF
jgi:hypothetical protein